MRKVRHNVLMVVMAAAAALACNSCGSPTLKDHLSARPSVSQLRDGDYQVVNEGHPGEQMNLSSYAKSGKYTVFVFSSPG